MLLGVLATSTISLPIEILKFGGDRLDRCLDVLTRLETRRAHIACRFWLQLEANCILISSNTYTKQIYGN
jgi:hypothetical protein